MIYSVEAFVALSLIRSGWVSRAYLDKAGDLHVHCKSCFAVARLCDRKMTELLLRHRETRKGQRMEFTDGPSSTTRNELYTESIDNKMKGEAGEGQEEEKCI